MVGADRDRGWSWAAARPLAVIIGPSLTRPITAGPGLHDPSVLYLSLSFDHRSLRVLYDSAFAIVLFLPTLSILSLDNFYPSRGNRCGLFTLGSGFSLI